MIDRIDRITKKLKQEIYSILQQDVDDSRLLDITITRVELTRDLRMAKVYVFLEGADEKEKQYAMNGLRKAGGFIRGEVSKRVPMKYTPKLSFRFDEGELRKRHIEDIFEQIREERGQDLAADEEGKEYEQE